jgi:hypothetical protein
VRDVKCLSIQNKCRFLLLIPESRKHPLVESLLYKQIVSFLDEEKIIDRFDIAFITINYGVVSCKSQIATHKNYRLQSKNYDSLPAKKNFRSGHMLITKAQIKNMADSIVEYITKHQSRHKVEPKIIAYVRGSYLEAIRMANSKIAQNLTTALKQSSSQDTAQKNAENFRLVSRKDPNNPAIIELFDDDELAQLKKKGIVWMKMGLRMSTAFIIFRLKIRHMAKNLVCAKNNQLEMF